MKNLKNIIDMKLEKIILILIGVFIFSSCQEFEEFNENPNEPTEVAPSVLMPSAIRQSVNASVNASFLLGNNVGQLTSKTLRTEVDTYNWNSFPFVWEGLYGSLTDVKGIETGAIEAGNELQEGAAIVLRSWIFANLTNAYGDIPYSEAIKGDENNLTPSYDSQEEIYADILSELDRASTLLAGGKGSIEGDILYRGDASKWQKFANSLRLRLLMTASDKISNAGNQFSNIVAAGDIFSSNEDNAILDYLSTFPNEFPLIRLKTGDFDAVALSATSLSIMDNYGDPRLSRYARPDNDNYNNPEFSGAVNGAGSCGKSGSRLGAAYFNDPAQTLASELNIGSADGIIMTYAEVEFLLAEAAAKGWIGDDIETHYQAGIEASMDYYQVNYAPYGYTDFNDYYNNSGVAYNAITDIWEQKWLALFFTGLEPFFEVRRWYDESGMSFDGIPFLSAPCDNLNNDNLPMRFRYPGQEQSLNAANYNDAVDKLGGSNDINASIWLVE
ncbi:SusD/RagB family nutrient-binding outer membrane lipoprotein [Marivirga sp.]|uniref:SusD/RagB family nutrient-binding outer membrane lipoprotein n=1 Tax=Marivirga sp. TaxID=2018662 RepID=UPI0025DC7503|nr:SusD/RagB family nutrient-binding outer membrane lipoprotein [Marivirga sp.]